MMQFIAVEDFYSDELKSHYVAGLGYTVRPQDDVLRELVKRWLVEGKIVEGGGIAIVTGTGLT